MASDMSEICTPKDAAGIIGIAERLVRAYCAEGRLAARKVGKQWIIKRKDAERFAAVPRPVGNPNLPRSNKKRKK